MNILPQSDKLVLAVFGILISTGSKYIKDDVSDMFDELFRNVVMRRFLIFAIAYIYSRDISASIVVTILFIMLMKATEMVKAQHQFNLS